MYYFFPKIIKCIPRLLISQKNQIFHDIKSKTGVQLGHKKFKTPLTTRGRKKGRETRGGVGVTGPYDLFKSPGFARFAENLHNPFVVRLLSSFINISFFRLICITDGHTDRSLQRYTETALIEKRRDSLYESGSTKTTP